MVIQDSSVMQELMNLNPEYLSHFNKTNLITKTSGQFLIFYYFLTSNLQE